VAREQRIVFGEDPELYDRARPGYPAALLDDVAALVTPGGRVVDIGCGTGKATVALAARLPNGVGVETDPAMAAIAERHLAAFPGWRVEISDFEKWEPGPDRYDLVTCAQAWHWFDPATREARAGAALTDGGWLALWWSRTDDGVDLPIRSEIDDVYARLAPDMSRHAYGPSSRPELPALAGFDPPTSADYAWAHRYTTADWLALMRTSSDHRLLAGEQREALLAEVAAVIDRRGGQFDHPYCSTLWLAQRS
jgi:SAM-dependent methyltransferase